MSDSWIYQWKEDRFLVVVADVDKNSNNNCKLYTVREFSDSNDVKKP